MTDQLEPTPRPSTWLYLPVAILALALATYPAELLAFAGAMMAMVLLAAWAFRASGTIAGIPPRAGLLLILGLAALGIAVPAYLRFPHPPPAFFVAGALVTVLSAVVIRFSQRSQPLASALTVTVLVAVAMSFALVLATAGSGLDVVELHYEAAEALADGESPYGDAVNVPNGSPYAEPGSTIVGYPYPPVTAVSFSLSVWMFGEPRWTSVVFWLATLVVGTFLAVGRQDRSSAMAVVALASIPAWALIIQAGWTELLSLGLIALAVLAWEKRPITASVVFGLAIASKQYFVVLLPLVLLHPAIRGRRSLLAIGTALATTIPLVALDPTGAWRALIEYHASTPPRPDSANLVGFIGSFGPLRSLPLILVIGLPLVVAWVLARRGDQTVSSFLISSLWVLGTFFMLSSQAFANYWFLIAGLCAIAMSYGSQRVEGLQQEASAAVSASQRAGRNTS
jgi:uncharacterized membrane protein